MSAGEMIHLPPARGEKWKCGWCGRVCYYPQATRGEKHLRMPYRYCPHCGYEIRKIREAGEPGDRFWQVLEEFNDEWERMKREAEGGGGK